MPVNNQSILIEKLYHLRNQYGTEFSFQKKELLQKIIAEQLKNKRVIESLHHSLLFIMAYPDDKTIYRLALSKLNELTAYIKANENIKAALYNTGITGSVICARFSFEIVKWLRETYKRNVSLDSIATPDSQARYIISALMPQVESEILQDEIITWKHFLNQFTPKGDDLLDTLIDLFDQSSLRPEVKDELWSALSIYVTVKITEHTRLPDSLTSVYFHKALMKQASLKQRADDEPVQIKLTIVEALKIIDCGRMILVQHSREIDPISFSDPEHVSYYLLQRGISIALLGMRPVRRQPIDCYMGYIVFKNGLPLGYAGSWVLFDSARIGLNIFPSYRGGESLYAFEKILKLHKHAYHLSRFSVDPYQLGKNNSDGIKSGSFWTYYKFGFRPMREELKQIAATEARKLKSQKGYRSPAAVLKKLADGRLEIILEKQAAVRFDANDLSVAYHEIVKRKYAGNRKNATEDSYNQLIKILQLPGLSNDDNLQFVIKNWCVILMADTSSRSVVKSLKEALRKIFLLKAHGIEEDYMIMLQRNKQLRNLVEGALSFKGD